MLRLGLTGGIGAGKSTVAAAMQRRGAIVVDADAIAREVVAPGTDGLAEVVAAFGEEILDDEGALDRPALAAVVFRDDDARERLNGIVHPRVGQRTAELLAEAPDDAVVVHDVPLLVENGMGPAFALVVVVDAPVEERVRRLARTRGMSEDDAHARIAAQADDTARAAAADVWVDNAGAREDVERAVDRLFDERVVPFEANARVGRAVPAPSEVVAPDPDWGAQAGRLAARLAAAGGDAVERVEHVGPTAVPGLPAPDVIDLLVLVADGRRVDEQGVGEAIATAGYPRTAAGRHGAADPGRPVDVRVVRASSDVARRLLAARDTAREAPERAGDDPVAVRDELEAAAR